MSHIEKLPIETMQYIAELCTWDSAPSGNGFPSEIDAKRYRCGDQWRPETYARYHASFARTSRHFYNILNMGLYTRNHTRDPAVYSCLRWAIKHDRLETLQRAYQYGADLSSYGPDAAEIMSPGNYGWNTQYVVVNRLLIPCDGQLDHLRTPLYDAVSLGLSHIAAFLLEAGVDVNTAGPRMVTYPLYIALKNGHLELAAMLVRHGAYLASDGVSALLDAHAVGCVDIVKSLLQRNDPASVAGKLHLGASTNNLELVKQALEESKADVNAKNGEWNTALHLAIKSANKELDVVKFLLRQPGIKISVTDDHGSVPLHLAAERGRIDLVQLLMEMPDVDVRYLTPNGESVLHMAARAGSEELFIYFLEQHGVEYPNEVHGQDMLVRFACRNEDDNRAKAFVQFLAKSGFQLGLSRFTLIDAIMNRNILTALSLLPLMPDDTIIYRGWFWGVTISPLHHALMEPHDHQTTLVRELLARGSDLEVTTAMNPPKKERMRLIASPLYLATTFARNKDCMELLLEAGASTDSIVTIRTIFKVGHDEKPSMSLLSGVLSYVWRDRDSIVEFPIQHPSRKAMCAEEEMFDLEDRILILLQHGATLNQVGNCSSALRLVCVEAEESSSWSLLKWVTDNATTKNVDIDHVDSLLSEFRLSNNNPNRRETHNILTGLRERLHREDKVVSDGNEVI